MLNLPPISERRAGSKSRTVIIPTHQSLDNSHNPNSAYNSTSNSPLLQSSSLSPQQIPAKRSQFAHQGNNILAQAGIRNTSRHTTNVSLPDRIPQTMSQIYPDGSQIINNSQSRSPYYSMSQQPSQQPYYNNSMQMGYPQQQQPMYQVQTPLLSVGYEYQPNFQYYGNGGGPVPGPRLLPQPSFAKVANTEHDKKLLSLIERQTEVIGHLNTKIMQQENQKIQRDKKELRSRLKQLEMANALKQRELEYRVQNTLLTNSPKLPKQSQLQPNEETEKKKGSERILSVLGKFVLATEMAGQQNKSKPGGNSRKYGSFLQAAFQGLKGSQSEKGLLGAGGITYTENDQLYYNNSKVTNNGDSPFSNQNDDGDDT